MQQQNSCIGAESHAHRQSRQWVDGSVGRWVRWVTFLNGSRGSTWVTVWWPMTHHYSISPS